MVLNQHERQHNKIYLLCLETREFINFLLASNNFYRPLQTTWTKIRTDRTSDLFWVQTQFETMIVFPQDFFFILFFLLYLYIYIYIFLFLLLLF